jgi:hypothetical protein
MDIVVWLRSLGLKKCKAVFRDQEGYAQDG